MIKNPSYKADVKLAKDSAAKFSGKGNPKSVSNVNVAQGPRTGNQGLTAAKRTDFVAAKQERAPLADQVTNAFAVRGKGRAESISKTDQVGDNTRAKFKK